MMVTEVENAVAEAVSSMSDGQIHTLVTDWLTEEEYPEALARDET